jgi:hypothetical protein
MQKTTKALSISLKTILLLLSITLIFNARAQVKFQKVYAPNGDVAGFSVVQTADKGYLTFVSIGGIAKTDSIGTLLHVTQFVPASFAHASLHDKPNTSIILATAGGGYIITFMSGIIKLAVDESIQWTRQYSGVIIKDIKQTTDGGYIICGNVKNGSSQDISLFKTDASGVVTWYKTYGGSLDDIALSVSPTSDGGYIVAGNTKSFGAGGQDAFLMKTNNIGVDAWERTYGDADFDMFSNVISLPGGGFAISGVSHDHGMLLKTDFNGIVKWAKGMDSTWPVKLIRMTDGSYLMGGDIGGKASAFITHLDSVGSAQ